LVLVSSRSVEGWGCCSGEGPQQVGGVAAGIHVWAWFACNFDVCVLLRDLTDSGYVVPL